MIKAPASNNAERMKNMGSLLRRLILVTSIIIVAWILTENYSLIFAKTIRGQLLDVKRVNDSESIITGRQVPAEYLFAFAIAVQSEKDGVIYTASSEDRQWAAAREGRCAVVKIFPHPPWDLKQGGYFNARLIEQYPCPANMPSAKTEAAPAAAPQAVTPEASPAPQN